MKLRPGLHHMIVALTLAGVLAASGCTHARSGDTHWERLWPPGDDAKVDSLLKSPEQSSSLITNNVSAKPDERSTVTDLDSRVRSAVAKVQTPSPQLGVVTEPPMNPARGPKDPRLSAGYEQLLARQLSVMATPSESAQNPVADAPPAPAEPAVEQSGEDLVPPKVVTEPGDAPPMTPRLGAQSQPPPLRTATPSRERVEAPVSRPPARLASTRRSPSSALGSAATDSNAGSSHESSSSKPASSRIGPNDEEAGSKQPSPTPPPVTQPAQPSPSPVTPGEWHRELEQSILSLRRELAMTSVDSSDRVRLEATLRLLYVAAQRREEAVRPIEGLDVSQQEFWKMGLAGFFELLDPDGPPIVSRRSKLALRYLREAVQNLGALSSLDVRNLAICQRVDSFGQYVEFDPYEFKPEQEVILYVEVNNFSVADTEEGYETELQGSYQIVDANGRRLADYELLLDRQVCRNIRTDYFLPYRIFLPKNLDPGDYRIQVTIEDKKGKKFGQTPAVEFKIRD